MKKTTNILSAVMASTIGNGIYDAGKYIVLQPELNLVNDSASLLKQAILKQSDGDWQTNVTTSEFGNNTHAEALSRIISHSTCQAGQISLILKQTN